ncbi:MAG: hypothetical protein QM764_07140 [Chitinophagaceae bacterium]
MKQLMFSLVIIITILLVNGCKSKDSKGAPNTVKEDFFPILPVINSQVAHVDTSMYMIIKLNSRDSTWDSTYIKREEFRGYAAEFLSLPDLTRKELTDLYTETKFFDASLNLAIFTYQAKDKSATIQKEEITIAPGDDGHDKMKNIIVDKLAGTADSTVTKHMLWNVDQSFQISSIIQKRGKPDSIFTTKITWQ